MYLKEIKMEALVKYAPKQAGELFQYRSKTLVCYEYKQDEQYPDLYYAGSSYLNLETTEHPNHIAYYIAGNHTQCHTFRLILNINDIAYMPADKEYLLACAKDLYLYVFDCQLDPRIIHAIKHGDDIQFIYKKTNVSLYKKDWSAGAINGFELEFSIG